MDQYDPSAKAPEPMDPITEAVVGILAAIVLSYLAYNSINKDNEISNPISATDNEPIPYHGKRPVIILNRDISDTEKKEIAKLAVTMTTENKARLTELGVTNLQEIYAFGSNYRQFHKASPINAFRHADFISPDKETVLGK